jgi:hypothetical protein
MQTDLTLSDITNLHTYKDWFVTQSWDAFANFAKFRKDILKKVKDDYITKKKTSNKRKQRISCDVCLGTPKRRKINESDQCNLGMDELRLDTGALNSIQKTCEIIVKTNRISKSKKKANQCVQEKIQEFSCQAYLEPPIRGMTTNSCKSEGMQFDALFDSTDKMTQSLGQLTAATSTQTLYDSRSDVSMQFPTSREARMLTDFPIMKVASVDAE